MENPEKGQKYNGLCASPRLSINIPSTKCHSASTRPRPSCHDLARHVFLSLLDRLGGKRHRLVDLERDRQRHHRHAATPGRRHLGGAFHRLWVHRPTRDQAPTHPCGHASGKAKILGPPCPFHAGGLGRSLVAFHMVLMGVDGLGVESVVGGGGSLGFGLFGLRIGARFARRTAQRDLAQHFAHRCRFGHGMHAPSWIIWFSHLGRGTILY